jgi:pimeloyl-ACP methyl ester carboxylesterase
MSDSWSRASTPGGQTFVFADEGEGPLVVLFHGFPDTPNGWHTIAPQLNAAGYRTVRPFLRGYHPETIVPGRGYDSRSNAEDALALLNALGEERAVLVGHDWGATVVWGAAALAPERVRGIVPIAIPHPKFLPREPGTLLKARHFVTLRLPWASSTVRRGDYRYLDTLYRRWAPNWAGPVRDETLAGVKRCFDDDRCLDGALAWYRELSLTPPAGMEEPPVLRGLVVGGTVDIVPSEPFRKSAAALPDGSDVLIAEGAGHWPHREAEEEFTARLIEFLRTLD